MEYLLTKNWRVHRKVYVGYELDYWMNDEDFYSTSYIYIYIFLDSSRRIEQQRKMYEATLLPRLSGLNLEFES